jgi:hypothetical protein
MTDLTARYQAAMQAYRDAMKALEPVLIESVQAEARRRWPAGKQLIVEGDTGEEMEPRLRPVDVIDEKLNVVADTGSDEWFEFETEVVGDLDLLIHMDYDSWIGEHLIDL